jgi:hypothetical protein
MRKAGGVIVGRFFSVSGQAAPRIRDASGDQPTAPSAAELQRMAAELQRMQDRQSVLLDEHLADMKAGLKLTDEQAKNWPAFESAVRDAAKGKADRWRQARELIERGEHPSPIERMSMMADHFEKSGAELKTVVDAAKPLYDNLTDAQKQDFGRLMREFKPHRSP